MISASDLQDKRCLWYPFEQLRPIIVIEHPLIIIIMEDKLQLYLIKAELIRTQFMEILARVRQSYLVS